MQAAQYIHMELIVVKTKAALCARQMLEWGKFMNSCGTISPYVPLEDGCDDRGFRTRVST